jgi:hypothetical protein
VVGVTVAASSVTQDFAMALDAVVLIAAGSAGVVSEDEVLRGAAQDFAAVLTLMPADFMVAVVDSMVVVVDSMVVVDSTVAADFTGVADTDNRVSWQTPRRVANLQNEPGPAANAAGLPFYETDALRPQLE